MRVLRGGDHLSRIQQLEIQGGRQEGVAEKGFVIPHRVLMGTERGQTVLDEVPESAQGLRAGHGPTEVVELSRMISEPLTNEIEDLTGDPVRAMPWRSDETLGSLRAEGEAIVGIEVPAPAEWLPLLHQDPGAASHLPIEILHAKLPPPLTVTVKITWAAQEVPILSQIEGH
jgi:hypothetical protein